MSDSQLDGFEQRTIPLAAATTYAGEPDEIVATLVRRGAPVHGRAMLYIHGWSDYFFQAHLAARIEAEGYDFYAIDLRRYGRSLREGQLAGFITDLRDYFLELNAAAEIIAEEGSDDLVVMGHSTGGLTAALWAAENPEHVTAVLLNAPWLDTAQSPMLRSAVAVLLSAVRSLSPTASLPVTSDDLYRRTISAKLDGEWDYNHNLKSDPAFLVRAGWLSAILAGQARVAARLGIRVPVLVLLSARSDFRRQWGEEVRRADIVLDVERLAERAIDLGRHVTIVRITDGIHDLALSSRPALNEYFNEVARWLKAYG